jgi:hypothetical protein
MLRTVDSRLTADGTLYADLEQAGKAPVVRAAFARCPALTAGDHRPIPFIRWWLDGAPGSVGTVKGGASPLGRMMLLPRRSPTTRRIYGPATFPKARPPGDWKRIYLNRSWRVYAAPECRAA